MVDVCKVNAIAELDGDFDFNDFIKSAQKEALERSGGDDVEAARLLSDVMEEMGQDQKLAAQRQIKQIAHSVQRRSTLSAQVKSFVALGKSAVKAFEEVVAGAFNRADYSAKEALRTFEAELHDNGLLPAFSDKSRQVNIAKEIAELNKKSGKPGISGDKEALHIAKIYEKYIQPMRAEMASVGVPISNLEGRIVRQFFSPEYLIRVDKQDFVDDILPKVDIYRTFQRKDVRQSEVIKYVEDYYDAVIQGEVNDIPLTNFDLEVQKKTYSRKQSEHRYLHLNTAEDVVSSLQKYTTKTLPEVMANTIRDTHYNGSVLLEMGVNPKNTLEAVRESSKSLASSAGELNKLSFAGNNLVRLGLYDFYSNGLYNPNIQAASNAANSLTRAVFLQLSGIAAVGDVGTSMSAAARIGAPALGQVGRILETAASLGSLEPDVKRAAVAGAEASSAHMTSAIMELHNGGSRVGLVSRGSARLSDFTMKWSGLQGMTNKMKEAAAISFKAQSYALKNKSFSELPKGMQFVFARSGISESDWNVIRSNSEALKEDILGAAFFDLYKVESLPDSAFAAIVRKGASSNEINAARKELKRKMLAASSVFADDAVPTPGLKERSVINMGSNPGTWSGALTQATLSLMGYPITYMYRVMGRVNETGNFASGYGLLLATSLVAGATSDFLWNLAKGRTRDYTAIAKGGAPTFDFLASSIVRGGFGGIYTSLALDYARFGSGPESIAAGAPVGLADSIFSNARETALDAYEGDFEAIVARGIGSLKYVPGANLPVFGSAFDYGIYYPLMDMFAPDKLRRIEKGWQKRTEGEMFIGQFNHLLSD